MLLSGSWFMLNHVCNDMVTLSCVPGTRVPCNLLHLYLWYNNMLHMCILYILADVCYEII